MCRVNVTEFRKNIFYYLDLSSKENIHITKNGNVVAVLSKPNGSYYDNLVSLCGCLKENDTGEDYDEMIGKEILKKCGF